MITRRSITDLFEKYKKNLSREEALNDSLLKADDQEGWIENLRTKSKMLRTLYIENEAMLNLYLRPFIEQENRLNMELADEFSKQIRVLFEEGLCDRLICINMTEALVRFYEKAGERDKMLFANYMLGGFYSRLPGAEAGKKCFEAFNIMKDMFKDYAQIEDWDIRRSILFSYYNFTVIIVNVRPYYKEFRESTAEYERWIIEEYDRAIAVYDDPVVRAMDGDKYDLDGLKVELAYDVFGNWICGSDSKDEMCPEMLERSIEVMDRLYKEELEKDENIFHMKDEIYCNYQKGQYYIGNIGLREYIDKVKAFCDYVLEHKDEDGEELTNSRYYQVNMYQIPNLAGIDGAKDHPEIMAELREYILPQFKKFISEIPRTREAAYINEAIKRTVLELIRSFGKKNVDAHYYLDIIMNRDETMMIHVAIVRRIVMRLLSSIFDREPELLIGILGTNNVLEVLEKRAEIEELAAQAALLFDVGKGDYIELVTLQSRRLLNVEKEEIHRHAMEGGSLLREIGFSDEICDIACGHHKSYDGNSGYPKEFDNTKSKVRFLIDLFRICDCMDAATDGIGRIYNREKTMSEFVDELDFGAGHIYNPDIVRLMRDDTELQDDLSYICSAGRISMYYEAYNAFIRTDSEDSDESAVQIKGFDGLDTDNRESEQADLLANIQEISREQTQVLEAIAKSTLFIARICLDDDTISVVHNSRTGMLNRINDGSFRDFIRNIGKEYFHPDDYARVYRLMEYGEFLDTLFASNGSFELEVRFRENDDWVWRRISFALAEEKNGVPRVIILSVTDIDSAKKQSQQIKEAMELAYTQAKQASVAKSEFLSNMSHDIRTPMNVIIGMTQIAERNTGNPAKIKECLAKIGQASEHLLELINDVLDMSKIESGKIELSEKPMAVRDVAENAFSMIRDTALKHGIACNIDMERLPDDSVIGDSVRIQEVFLNLLSNAVKYTPDGGSVNFTAEKLSEEKEYNVYRFVVKDSGIGMSEEFMEKLFEPFSREQSESMSHVQGTGLGLSITKSIVDMMQGSINVTSRQGEGSSFEVILKLRPADKSTVDRGKELEIDADSYDNYFAGKRVLLVEDNDLNREIFVELISGTGVVTDTAVNGLEAVRLIKEHKPDYYDIVFMDIQMPVMDGYEAARRIRELESGRQGALLPIIALTANAFSDDRDRAIKAGMNAHIAKPIVVSKLIAVMLKWIKK